MQTRTLIRSRLSLAIIRALTGFACLCFSAPIKAKIGENVPQLVKRFGNAYTIEHLPSRDKYKFRSANVSVDAVVTKGVSVAETYFSDHPLAANGESPKDIVRAVLKTNAPGLQWVEVESKSFGANYALESSDHNCVAFLKYKGPQQENAIWTMTVARRDSWTYAVTVEDLLGPSSSPDTTRTAKDGTFDPDKYLSDKSSQSRSGMPSLPWETPSSKVLTVFINHVSDVEALYKRPMNMHDGEWVYAIDRVARSAADYAVSVDLISRLHWQPEDRPTIKSYSAFLREMLRNEVDTLDSAVGNTQLAVIREEARSLRNDIREFDTFISSMIAAVDAPRSPSPPQHPEATPTTF